MLNQTLYQTGLLAGLLLGAACTTAAPPEARTAHRRNAMDPVDQRVREKFAAFESKRDPARIHEALEAIMDAERDVPPGDKGARQRGVSRWLGFFAALDRTIDPKWDPKDEPAKVVPPPPSQGAVSASGEVDPATIPDPVARARYVQALKVGKERNAWYNLQLQLASIGGIATRAFGRLLADRYPGSPAERAEYEAVLQLFFWFQTGAIASRIAMVVMSGPL